MTTEDLSTFLRNVRHSMAELHQLLRDARDLLEQHDTYSDGDGEEYNDETVCTWLRRYALYERHQDVPGPKPTRRFSLGFEVEDGVVTNWRLDAEDGPLAERGISIDLAALGQAMTSIVAHHLWGDAMAPPQRPTPGQGSEYEVCGDERDGFQCQLLAGHDGSHACPTDDLSAVKEWSTSEPVVDAYIETAVGRIGHDAPTPASILADDSLNREQPKPQSGSGPAIWDLVIADMRERDKLGEAKYGRRLRAGDGRDHLMDAYQEALDLAVYLRQEICERDGR